MLENISGPHYNERMARAPDVRRVPVLMTETMLKQIDEWRRTQVDLPNRAEAVRRLLAIALEAENA